MSTPSNSPWKMIALATAGTLFTMTAIVGAFESEGQKAEPFQIAGKPSLIAGGEASRQRQMRKHASASGPAFPDISSTGLTIEWVSPVTTN